MAMFFNFRLKEKYKTSKKELRRTLKVMEEVVQVIKKASKSDLNTAFLEEPTTLVGA